MLGPLDLTEYAARYMSYWQRMYLAATGQYEYPPDTVVYIELLTDDRLSTEPTVCRFMTVAEMRARAKYHEKPTIWTGLHGLDTTTTFGLVLEHADGRVHCDLIPIPDATFVAPPEFKCVILDG